ncbi:MAG: hypothetical protein WD154_04300 [Nitrosopumilaceae archaeon]
MSCSCHCINCGSVDLESNQVGKSEDDGYSDMHHTCKKCETHFDHLEGNIFESCNICNYKTS